MKNRKRLGAILFVIIICILSVFFLTKNKKEDTEEKIIEKTENMTTYEYSDGKKKTVIHDSNIRFYNEDGVLVDYDPSLVKSNKEDVAYENKSGDKKLYLPKILSKENSILLEYEDYQIRISPDATTDNIVISEENTTNAEEREISRPIKATYKTDNISYEYISLSDGVKENIILNEKPNSNIFEFELTTNLKLEKSKTDESVLLKDTTTNEIKASIDIPNITDINGDYYSENVTYNIEKMEDNKYIVDIVVDENYFENENLAYPVTIDPTINWSGSSKIIDTYILSADTYADINFYDSGTTAFPIGYTSSMGTCRSLIRSLDLLDTVKDKYIESATLTMYETSSCDANITVNAYRIIDGWTKANVTWNNKPRYNTSNGKMGTVKTKGELYAANVMDIKTYVQGLANGTYSVDKGLMLKLKNDTSSSAGYVKYFGSRHANESLRPKLIVEYYDKPTAPSTLNLSKEYLKVGDSASITWAGVESHALDYIEYRIGRRDDATGTVESLSESIVPYTKLSTSVDGTEDVPTIKTLPDGCYRIIVRGVDKGGNKGTGKGFNFHVDSTIPTIDNVSLTNNTIIWTNANDLHFKEVAYSINNEEYKTMGTTTSGSFSIPENELSGSGNDLISVIAIDMSGNTSEVNNFTYTYDVNSDIDDYKPVNINIDNDYGKNTLRWELNSGGTLIPSDISYSIYCGTTSTNVNTLIAENIKNLYFTDMRVMDKYYYKVVAVKGNNTAASSIIEGITFSDLNKKFGTKDYLSYLDYSTPNGNGSVEKSSGNLSFSQSDFDLPTETLPYSMNRFYNHQNEIIGMFGIGWTDSFHKELYKNNSNIIFMDSDGSTYQFMNTNGNYSCDETKEYTLTDKGNSVTENYIINSNTITITFRYEIITKDNTIYRFDESGKLVVVCDLNDNAIVYQYDNLGRLCKTLNTNSVVLNFSYNNNSHLIDEIILPDNTVIIYTYTNNTLTTVKHYNSAKTEYIEYKFEYNSNKKLSSIIDAMNNPYIVTYSNNKVTKIEYPNGDYHLLEYTNATTTKEFKYTSDNKKLYETSVIFDAITGKTLTEIDTDGLSTTYTYLTNSYLVEKITQNVEYQELINNFVETKTKTIETILNYNENEDITTASEIFKDENIETEKNITTYTYDTENNVNKSNPIKTQTVNIKNEENIITEETISEYDSKGNIITAQSIIDDSKTTQTFYSNGLVNTQTNIQLNNDMFLITNNSVYTYDEIGNNTSLETTSADIYTKDLNEYDSMGRVIRSIELYKDNITVKNIIEYTYDFMGRVLSITTKQGSTNEIIETVTKQYNANGTLIEETENGITSTYDYDNMNRLINRKVKRVDYKDSVNYKTEYSYETLKDYNDGTIVIDKENIYTTKTYKNNSNISYSESYVDEKGNELRIKENGIYTDYAYDKTCNKIMEVTMGSNANGSLDTTNKKISIFIYNENTQNTYVIENPEIVSNKFKVSNSSIVSESVYDANGNVIEEIDANGNTIRYTYDEQMRLSSVIDANNNTTNILYEILNNRDITKVIHPNNMVSIETKNESGSIISTEDRYDDLSIETKYEYDENGEKIKEIFSNGDYKTYEYVNDLLSKENSYTSENVKTLEIIYEYDKKGNRISELDYEIIDGTRELYNQIYYTYNKQNRLEYYAEINKENNDVSYFQSYLSYDTEGKLMNISYPESFLIENNRICTMRYEYDNDTNRLIKIFVTSNNGTEYLLREYSYYSDGNLESIKENGLSSNNYVLKTYEYDVFGRITKIDTKNSTDLNTVKERHTYHYDKNSNITYEYIKNNYGKENGLPEEEIREYQYNNLNQLVESIRSIEGNSPSMDVNIYNYDDVGNLVYKYEEGKVTNYNYNKLNQLITEDVYLNSILTSNKIYTYDANGNNISIVDEMNNIREILTYDVSNQLNTYTKWNNNKISVQSNKYNASGKRIQKIENDKTTNYFYLNDSLLYTLDENNNLTSHNMIDPNGEIFATFRINNNDICYYIYNKDIRMSVTNIIKDLDKRAEVSYEYSDFGETKITGNIDFYNEICYTSGIYDGLSNLYYLNARYYNPISARFITMDTYRGDLKDTLSLNLYAYCENSPINYVDSSGHAMINVVCGIIGGVCGWKFGDYIARRLGYSSGTKYWTIRTAATVGGAALGAFLSTRIVKIAANYLRSNSELILKMIEKKGLKKTHTALNFLGINPFTCVKNGSKFVAMGRKYNSQTIVLSRSWAKTIIQQAKKFGYTMKVDIPHKGYTYHMHVYSGSRKLERLHLQITKSTWQYLSKILK